MALSELLAGVLSWVVESPENTVLVATMLVVGHHVRRASALGAWLSMTGVGVMFLAVAMLLGLVDVEVSAVAGLVEAAAQLVGSLTG